MNELIQKAQEASDKIKDAEAKFTADQLVVDFYMHVRGGSIYWEKWGSNRRFRLLWQTKNDVRPMIELPIKKRMHAASNLKTFEKELRNYVGKLVTAAGGAGGWRN